MPKELVEKERSLREGVKPAMMAHAPDRPIHERRRQRRAGNAYCPPLTMARTKSNGPNTSTATIGFEAKLWLTAEQAVPAPHFAEVEYNGARPEGLLGLIFPGADLNIAWGPAARDFGRGQGGEAGGASRTGHSPQRAVTAEPTPATGKRPAARRGFGEKAGWLRCSSVGDRCGYPLVPVRKHSRLAIQPFPRKQDSHGIFRPAPEYISDTFEEHRAKLLAGQGDDAGGIRRLNPAIPRRRLPVRCPKTGGQRPIVACKFDLKGG